MGTAAVLVADQFDAPSVVLVEHHIVEQNVAPRTECHLWAHRLPELMRSEQLSYEKVAHVVVHQFFQTVDQIRAYVINLAVHQQLPVKLCRKTVPSLSWLFLVRYVSCVSTT